MARPRTVCVPTQQGLILSLSLSFSLSLSLCTCICIYTCIDKTNYIYTCSLRIVYILSYPLVDNKYLYDVFCFFFQERRNFNSLLEGKCYYNFIEFDPLSAEMVKHTYSFSRPDGQKTSNGFIEEKDINETQNKNLKIGKKSGIFTISGNDGDKTKRNIGTINGDQAETKTNGMNGFKNGKEKLNGSVIETNGLGRNGYVSVTAKGKKKEEKENKELRAYSSYLEMVRTIVTYTGLHTKQN